MFTIPPRAVVVEQMSKVFALEVTRWCATEGGVLNVRSSGMKGILGILNKAR